MKISKNKNVRKILVVFFTIQMIFAMHMIAYANNYAENAVKWGLDQAFWVVIFITIIVAIGAWMRHATSAIVITIIIGGALAFFCKAPDKIIVFGSTLAEAIFGG